ncbi:MAG TPA: hypothetical protein VM537_37105 [Anaerolineae bacterium]|nr:hypothetical protein [Anaerolineae bacterium]
MRQRPEKAIQHGIKDLLKQLGFSVYNLSQPRHTMQTHGLPDLIALGHSYTLFIEVKAGKNKQTPAQREFQQACSNTPAFYVVWYSAAEAWDWLVERHVVSEAV